MTVTAVDWFNDHETFGFYFVGDGSLLIKFSEFEKVETGCIVIEQLGRRSWEPLSLNKIGRGMATNAVAFGPAVLRGQIWWDPSMTTNGVRVRNNGLLDMQVVEVTMTFADKVGRNILRGASNYVIQETPDLRDLIN